MSFQNIFLLTVNVILSLRNAKIQHLTSVLAMSQYSSLRANTVAQVKLGAQGRLCDIQFHFFPFFKKTQCKSRFRTRICVEDRRALTFQPYSPGHGSVSQFFISKTQSILCSLCCRFLLLLLFVAYITHATFGYLPYIKHTLTNL